jgi:hypothetical protein
LDHTLLLPTPLSPLSTQDVDWEQHPAEGIFSASATHYLVKRAGLDITNYGTVKIKTAHQLRSADQKPGGWGAVGP